MGMVSEGDLIRPDQAAREAQREWWLEILKGLGLFFPSADQNAT
jgi:hypothetical protein